jgi:orotidine-5'-phosphate decarboxylase
MNVPIPPRDRLIVGLDVSPAEAGRMVARLGDTVSVYKIGYQLGYATGLGFARELVEEGKQVFLDLKLHDIGNTVARGVESIAGIGARFLTVHAYPQTMRAAVEGRGESRLQLLAVTVLTSYDDSDLEEAGYRLSVRDLVRRRAVQARDCGIDGIVAAAPEAEELRGLLGSSMAIVTPGIRPPGAETGDQKRVMTPRDAIRAGASHLVVARPILGAADPGQAAEAIIADIAAACG